MTQEKLAASAARDLARPFAAAEVGWKPQAVKGNRALAVCYIDVRNVMNRLDEVAGVCGWEDRYEILPDGVSVMCRLTLRFVDPEGQVHKVTKADVGGPSEQPDGGDRMKAAFSDALKRAAVKFGIGRYLYELPAQWADYDPQKKQFVTPPNLPAWALPGGPTERPASAKADAGTAVKNTKPANGQELFARLCEADTDLATRGLCRPGELMSAVESAGHKAGYGVGIRTWTAGPAIDLAIQVTRDFKARVQPKAQPTGR